MIGRIYPDGTIATVAALILTKHGMTGAQSHPELPWVIIRRGFPNIIMRHAQDDVPALIQYAQHSIVYIDDPSVRRKGHDCLSTLSGIPYGAGHDMIGVD